MTKTPMNMSEQIQLKHLFFPLQIINILSLNNNPKFNRFFDITSNGRLKTTLVSLEKDK